MHNWSWDIVVCGLWNKGRDRWFLSRPLRTQTRVSINLSQSIVCSWLLAVCRSPREWELATFPSIFSVPSNCGDLFRWIKIASHTERSECAMLIHSIAVGHVLQHLCMASLAISVCRQEIYFVFLLSRSVSGLSNVNACAWRGSRRYAMWQNLKEMHRMSCNFQTTDSARYNFFFLLPDSDEWMWKWTNGAALHPHFEKNRATGSCYYTFLFVVS